MAVGRKLKLHHQGVGFGNCVEALAKRSRCSDQGVGADGQFLNFEAASLNPLVEDDTPMMQIVGGLSGVATKLRERIEFNAAEDCRRGNDNVSSFLVWVRKILSSRSDLPEKCGRILHPLLSVRHYAQGHGGRLFVEFVQRAVQTGDER